VCIRTRYAVGFMPGSFGVGTLVAARAIVFRAQSSDALSPHLLSTSMPMRLKPLGRDSDDGTVRTAAESTGPGRLLVGRASLREVQRFVRCRGARRLLVTID
jgi:hypothetical protein